MFRFQGGVSFGLSVLCLSYSLVGYVDLTTNSITPCSFGTFNSEGCTIDSSHVLEMLLLRNTTIIADLEQPVLFTFSFFLPFFLCCSSTGSISVEQRCNPSYVAADFE